MLVAKIDPEHRVQVGYTPEEHLAVIQNMSLKAVVELSVGTENCQPEQDQTVWWVFQHDFPEGGRTDISVQPDNWTLASSPMPDFAFTDFEDYCNLRSMFLWPSVLGTPHYRPHVSQHPEEFDDPE